MAVALAEVGRGGNVDAAFFPAELQRGRADAVAAADHVHPEGAAVAQPLYRKMGAVCAANGLAVQGDRVFRPAGRGGGFIPVQHRVIFGAAYIQIALFHGDVLWLWGVCSFLHIVPQCARLSKTWG